MATITTRSGKGSPLTNTEVDNNFENLNTAKYESGNSVTFSDATLESGSAYDYVALNLNNSGSASSNQHAVLVKFNINSGSTSSERARITAAKWDSGLTNGELKFYVKHDSNLIDAHTLTPLSSIFNDGAVARDFRVESVNNTHMLFVDASTDRIGINQSSPDYTIHVGDGGGSQRVHLQTNGGGALFSGVDSVNNPLSGFRWGHLNGTDRLEGAVGTTEIIDWRKTALYFKPDGTEVLGVGDDFVTVNNGANNVDFRVESVDNTHMLFVDASANAVGIGKQPDSNGYYALDIDGVIRQNGQMVAGKVYPYSTSISRALNAPTQWFKIWSSSDASSKIVNLKIHHGGDNTNFWGEFTVNISGYSFTHSITVENYTYYNGPELKELFTRTVSNTTLEIWAKVDALTSYAGNFIVQSNHGGVVSPLVAETTEPTGINTRLRSTHWPGSSTRPSMALSNGVNVANAAPVRFYRSDDTRHSSIYHDNSGLKIETNQSGDNLYIRNTNGATGNVILENGADNYAVIVNDGSYSSDFRVESNDNSHMLYVEGATNRVGIGVDTPETTLDVGGSAQINGFIIKEAGSNRTNASWSAGDWITIATLPYGELVGVVGIDWSSVSTPASAHHGYARVKVGSYYNSYYYGWETRLQLLDQQHHNAFYFSEFRVIRADGYTNQDPLLLQARSASDVTGGTFKTYVERAYGPGDTSISPSTPTVDNSPNGNTVQANIYTPKNSIAFSGMMSLSQGAVINEGGWSTGDFRVESATNTHMLFVDASTDRIGINDSAPVAALSVNGDILRRTYNGFSSNTLIGTADADANWYNVGNQGDVYLVAMNSYGSGAYQQSGGNIYIKAGTPYSNGTSGGYVTLQSRANAIAGATRPHVLIKHEGTSVAEFDDREAVFNEDGGSGLDFRVESVDYTHMLFLDASANTVLFGRSTHSWSDNCVLIANPSSGGIAVTANGDWGLQMAGSRSERIRFFSSAGGSSATVGNVSVSTTGTTYSTASDRRLKENIETITDGTEKLMAMNPVTHTWIGHPDLPAVHGFIAQEMIEVVPEAVSGTPDGEEMMSMDYGRITPILVAALQDAHKKIAELETRLNELEAK